ncbi:MAG TPA: PEP/pyruvate-binding domain-containing protein [Armatimonadota bacterium]|nr:PEP/pyruvate-binding domain-containing protein [Armatimonadota bacterium]
MTVRTTEGTHEEPVPADRRTLPVLDAAQVKQLIHVGLRIERLYDRPMDIEWARSHHHLFIMQARPITALHGHNPTAGEWNDSLFGDYLWSNGNLGEAIPDVMTPCTWSLVQIFMADAMASISVAPYYGYGNIGGRFYMNLSISAALTAAFGFTSTDFRVLIEDVFGRLPEGLEIPLVPLARWHVLRRLLPVAAGVVRRVRRNRRRLPAFLAAAPARCEALHARIQAAGAAELVELWQTALAPFFHEANRMLEAAAKQEGSAFVTIRHRLRALVGEADANALLTGLHGDTAELASLGPLLGLTQLARGEIDRATFARRYGHRSPHEFEVSLPRPAEDPAWIDQQLAGLRATPVEVAALLARQREAQAAAWERFVARSPRRAAAMRRHMARMANVLRHREAARSEVIRVFGVLRAFVLRAGELTGQGDGLFFLSIDEVLDVLTGDNTSLDSIAARRAAHARYTALPPYPALIRGHFDPFRWAADPRRRSDIYDATHVHAPTANGGAITGFPGAAGVVGGAPACSARPRRESSCGRVTSW